MGGLHTLGRVSLRNTLLIANIIAVGFVATYHLLLRPPLATELGTLPGALVIGLGSRDLDDDGRALGGESPMAVALGLEDRGGRRRREGGGPGLGDLKAGSADEDAQRLLGASIVEESSPGAGARAPTATILYCGMHSDVIAERPQLAWALWQCTMLRQCRIRCLPAPSQTGFFCWTGSGRRGCGRPAGAAAGCDWSERCGDQLLLIQDWTLILCMCLHI